MSSYTITTNRGISLFFALILSIPLLTAQNRIVIKEKVEINPAVISFNQLSENTGQVVTYPFFSEAYFNGKRCVKANFPIEGYKAKVSWSINISDSRVDNGGPVDYGLAQFPAGPVIDVITLSPGQSGTINGSIVMDKDYYAWGNQFIEFIIFVGMSNIGLGPNSVNVSAAGDIAFYNFSFDQGAGGWGAQGIVELTAENPWASLCPTVLLSKRRIKPGDTVTVSVMGKDVEGNLTSYPEYPQFLNPQFFDFSIISGAQYGNLAYLDTPYPFLDTVMTMMSPISFIADTSIDQDSVLVIIRSRFWNCNSDWGACGPAVDTVTIKNECLLVVPQDVLISDTTLLSFVYGSSGKPVPMSKSLDVSILGGSDVDNGTLLVNGSTGTRFPSVTQPIKYIAPKEIPEDELNVQIVAVESDELSMQVQGGNTNQNSGTTLSKSSTISPRIVAILKAQGSGNSCPIGGVKVIVPNRIELEIAKNILNHNETTPLKTILYDKNNMPINNFDANVQFDLGSEGEGYLNLIGWNQGMSITVPYSLAFSGFASCSANGKEWEGRLPLITRISASGVFGKKYRKSIKRLFIVGSNTIGEIFYQNDPQWGSDIYDHISKTIADKGCALTCMAMILSAYGVDVDPGKLNKWMIENNGFDSNGGVFFEYTISGYPGSPIKVMYNSRTGDDPSDLQKMDESLSGNNIVIAQVDNPSSGNYHWIVVTSETSNGDYRIIDPNNVETYKERTTMSNVYKEINRYLTIGLK